MAEPFHYAFLVRDLDATRSFYAGLLGATEGRSAATWVDFDFFGNQISAHLADDVPVSRHTGHVDGVAVPMPHFGAIVPWAEFDALAARLRGAGTTFVIEPYVRFVGEPAEQATMFLLDPSGNALEFKAFRHPERVFA
jgi:extradiol dioxygenase family protein